MNTAYLTRAEQPKRAERSPASFHLNCGAKTLGFEVSARPKNQQVSTVTLTVFLLAQSFVKYRDHFSLCDTHRQEQWAYRVAVRLGVELKFMPSVLLQHQRLLS